MVRMSVVSDALKAIANMNSRIRRDYNRRIRRDYEQRITPELLLQELGIKSFNDNQLAILSMDGIKSLNTDQVCTLLRDFGNENKEDRKQNKYTRRLYEESMKRMHNKHYSNERE